MMDGPHPPLRGAPLPAGEGRSPSTSPAGRGRAAGAGEGLLARARIVAAARGWIGTPYIHQAAAKGQGTDCLGLIRGLYAELYGAEPEAPPPYTPDWNEARASEEPLLSAARRHLKEVEIRHPGAARSGASGVHLPKGAPSHFDRSEDRPRVCDFVAPRGDGVRTGWAASVLPAQILIFRILPAGPAKHCGVAVGEDHFVHAYAGRAVIESWLSRWWIERLAGVFEFPGVEG